MITVKDIHEKQKRREGKRKEVFEAILEECGKLIKKSDDMRQTFCIYNIPELLIGYPLFNMNECIGYLMSELQKRGFQTHYLFPKNIVVSWSIKPAIDYQSCLSITGPPKPRKPRTSKKVVALKKTT